MKIERSFLTLTLVMFAMACVLPAGTIYLLPTGTANQGVASYSQEPFLTLASFDIPANTASVYINASSTKLYAVTKEAAGAIVVQAPGSSTPIRTINLGVGPTSSLMTPDGQRLAVLAGSLHVYDTNNDSEVSPAYGIDVGASPNMIVSDLRSSRILVLSSAQKSITAVDLATKAIVGAPLVLGAEPSTMVVGPNGLLYVSAQNRVYEVDTRSMTVRGEITVSGLPGKLQFTPDGTKALAVNTTPTTGTILFAFDLTTRTLSASYPYAFTLTLDQLVITNNDRAYGLSLAAGRVVKINLSPLVVESVSFTDLGTTGNIISLTASNELPNARNLYFLDSSYFYMIDLGTNRLVQKVALTKPASEVVSREITIGQPGSLLQFGNNQSVTASGVSAPVVIRALNAAGKAVFDVPVTFSTTTAGASILSATASTNLYGYAMAYVTVPATNGTVAVNARTTGTSPLSSDFTLTVGSTPGGGGGGTPTTGAGVSIVSGDGQITMEIRQTDYPLRALVKDASGNPVANAPVTWAVSNGSGYLSHFSSTTDADGIAETYFIGGTVLTGQSFVQSNVTATTAQGTATFTATTVLVMLTGGGSALLPILDMQAPDPGIGRISGKLGAVLKGAVRVRAAISSGPQIGYPVPNVGLFLTSDQDPATGPVPACVGGTVLSDSTGTATCDVVITGRQGTSNFGVKMGGDRGWILSVTAEPGDPGQIKLIQGDGQTGNAGATLPLALVGEVSDGYGNKLSGAEVTWEVVTANSLTLVNTVSTSDAQGRISTRVTLGSMAGTFQIRARSKLGSALGVFSVTVNVAVSNLNKVSGDNQSVLISTAFAQPLVVKVVNAQNAGVQGVAVAFSVTSGTATLSTASVATGADGTASVSVTAGATPGTILVKAAITGYSVTFTLASRLAGPEVTAADIVNGAGGQPGVTPGGIVTIYGKGIATGISGSVTPGNLIGPLPLKLANVEVLFGATAAPIYNVSNVNGMESVTVQAPFELGAPGTVLVTVKVAGATTVVPNVPTIPLQPGLFETVNSSGVRYAVAIGDDGRYIGPGQGARPGEIVRVFVTGVGQTAPATGTNRAGVPGQNVLASLVAGFNNEGVRLVSAEYMVGVVGVYIVAFEVPATATSGSKPMVVAAVSADGSSLIFSNPSTIAVQ
jgi:uncharacterized protein (TIGR03437 family)